MKARITQLRESIERLDREDIRKTAFAEAVRRKAEERKHFKWLLETGRLMEASGIREGYDADVLGKVLAAHLDEIMGGKVNG